MRILQLIAVLATVGLSGCATPNTSEMRAAGPFETLKSAKAEDDYAKCLLFAWQDIRLAGEQNKASIQPGRDGGTTVMSREGGYFVDVTPTPSGTSVKYYEVSDTWISKRLREPVRSCL